MNSQPKTDTKARLVRRTTQNTSKRGSESIEVARYLLYEVITMAKMCPVSGCKTSSKMCIHDKLMVGMGALIVLGGIAAWGLRLI